MVNILQKLWDKKLIFPPKFCIPNTQYLTMMGSVAYGVSSDTSDVDLYGFTIPYKDVIFPHLRGEIPGFGTQTDRFDQYQQHHIQDGEKSYDIRIMNIVKYFQLAMDNNPDILDSLFTPINCVLHSTAIGNLVRENRKIFLSRRCYVKLKGYSYSQLHKMSIKTPQEGSKRYEDIQKYGMDVKFAYHVVRLLNQCEQILLEHDLDLLRSKEQLKAIRKGEVTEAEIRDYFKEKEKNLEKLYADSTLPAVPDEAKIKQLLLDCLEQHFGTLEGAIIREDEAVRAIREMQEVLNKYQRFIQ